MKVILLGYMACGKSVIGKYLSKLLQLPFYDLDDLIVRYNNMSIKDIFLYKKEIYFRNIERIVMNNFFTKKHKYILSLGGGTPCYKNNIDIINNQGVSIYLKSDIPTLYDRLIKEKHTRPILYSMPNDKMLDFIKQHLCERESFYLKAHISIVISHKTISDIVNEICNHICC